MEIYVVRHTQPDIENGVCYGWADISVASTYEAELEVIRKTLNKAQFDAVYSSPLVRCVQLAKDLHKEAIVFDDRLKEVNFGDWELRKWDDIPLEESQPWMNDFVHISPPNGESLEALYNRVVAFLTMLEKSTLERVLITTHAGVIRCTSAYLNGTPLPDIFSLQVTYGQVFKFTLKQ